MYLTFVLRALGYTDANGADFTWDNPYSLARRAGILSGSVNTGTFWRADIVLVSYSALSAALKDSEQTLADKLIAEGVFSRAAYDAYYDANAIENSDPSQDSSPLTREDVYEQCAPAVFYIEVYNAKGTSMSSGSGFFIDGNGIAFTNYHVIKGQFFAKITVPHTGKTYDVLGVYDYNDEQDWAVLKIAGSGFPYLDIDTAASAVAEGDTAYAIGCPYPGQDTISEGTVRSAGKLISGISYLEISNATTPKISGSALVNQYGKVIGVVVKNYSDDQDLNLVLPMRYTSDYSSDGYISLSALINSPDSKLAAYPDFPEIPDFGSYFGASMFERRSLLSVTGYYYTLRSLKDCGVWDNELGLSNYQSLLQDWGFVYETDYYNGSNHYYRFSSQATASRYSVTMGEAVINGTSCFTVAISPSI
jgi:S1-C subfamily serine protease